MKTAPAKACTGLGHRGVGLETDLLVFDGTPEPLDEDIVAPCTSAIHRDRDVAVQQYTGKGRTCELAALVCIEDVRILIFFQSLFKRLNTEGCLHGDRRPLGQYPAREPVNDGSQIDKAIRHRDAGDVHGPVLVGPLHLHVPQEIGVNLVAGFEFEILGLRYRASMPIFCSSVAVCLRPISKPSRFKSSCIMREPANG